jgi:hypothetical protein
MRVSSLDCASLEAVTAVSWGFSGLKTLGDAMRTGRMWLACLLRDACLTSLRAPPAITGLIVCTAAATAAAPATSQLAARSLLGCMLLAADGKHA